MEGWLELPGRDGKLLPGYGWVFGVGDGTSNVGLGILNSSKDFGKLDYKQVLREWTAGMPADWGFTPDNQVGEIRGAALPMGFNRMLHYSQACCCSAMPAAWCPRSTARASPTPWSPPALRRNSSWTPPPGPPRAGWGSGTEASTATDAHLARYADYVRQQWGSHFTLGRAFAALIGKPAVMKLALRTGMPVPVLMRFVVRMLARLD